MSVDDRDGGEDDEGEGQGDDIGGDNGSGTGGLDGLVLGYGGIVTDADVGVGGTSPNDEQLAGSSPTNGATNTVQSGLADAANELWSSLTGLWSWLFSNVNTSTVPVSGQSQPASASTFNDYQTLQQSLIESRHDVYDMQALAGLRDTLASNGIAGFVNESEALFYDTTTLMAISRSQYTDDSGNLIIQTAQGTYDTDAKHIVNPSVLETYNTVTGWTETQYPTGTGSYYTANSINGIPVDPGSSVESYLPVLNDAGRLNATLDAPSPRDTAASMPRPERNSSPQASLYSFGNAGLSEGPAAASPWDPADDRMERYPAIDIGVLPQASPSPVISAMSDDEIKRIQEDQILTLDLDPDVAFPVTPEARWSYSVLYDLKQSVYLPLNDWFDDQRGTREPFRYIGSNGNFVETASQRDHLDALGALFRIGSMFPMPEMESAIFGSAVAGEVTTTASKMAESAIEVFQTLAKFRDEEFAMMHELYPEFLGSGRVDPSLGIGGASRATWFGNVLNERVRQRVSYAIGEGTLTEDLQWTRQGQSGLDFWLPNGTGFDLFPASERNLLRHEKRYVGSVQSDGTTITDVWPLLYSRTWLP